MLSKKNPQLKLNQEAERRSRFSIRKLSIGATSVMIGCFLYLGGNSAVASADEAPADQVVQQESNNDQAQEENPSEQTPDQAVSPTDDSQQEEATPSESEQETKGEILPQTTVEGETPNLDIKGLWNQQYQEELQNKNIYIEPDDSSSYNIAWDQAPDVSKEGKTTGKAKVSYRDYDDAGNEVEKSFDIDVPVTVVAGQKKQDNEVRNALNIVNQDINDILYHYTCISCRFNWIGCRS
ncbi:MULTISPECIES: YSIRK-type signal peptide-containing protein [Lactobacillus]|uniref:YSIRK-type signal peptide-containing protein n=1 Tax=Lactobacillus TaxID=1578 RepID=UPI0024936F8B|nr:MULTISPECIES: YSIRK-type signal peptide-containing protein [Lactobacillus]